jgi:hypothetical protein
MDRADNSTVLRRHQHGVFAQVLDLLRKQCDDALSKLSEAVPESISDGLLGVLAVPLSVFDDDEEQIQLDKTPYDSPALVGRFRLQSV